MTDKNNRLSLLFLAGCVGVIIVAAFVWIAGKGGIGTSDTFCEGVTISGIDMSGLSKEQGTEKVEALEKKLARRTVTIGIDDNKVTVTADKLGFQCDDDEVIDKAYNLGKTGGITKRFNKLSKEDKEKGTFSLNCQVDEEILTDFVKQNCTKYDIKAKNSKLKLENGAFVATKSKKGREVQVKDTVAVISHELTTNQTDEALELEAVVRETKPEYTKKQVEKCQDLLGSYSTNYSTSTAARASNVKTAAEYINGTVVYPGKTFSVIKTIKDRTEENGYKAAAEYSSGKVVEGIGGGVCQVSTTLYNAVINAELEIVERSPHSMVVSYVDVARDAAISGDYKDFKFKNNTDVPVYLAAVADGATLSFRIYGEETRPENREIKFKSQILEKIEPGKPVETVDKTKPEGYRAVTQSAHVGYKAKLWKLVYVDGVRTEKVLVNSSSYAAEPEYVTVGSKPKATKKPAETEAPDSSAAPESTTAPKATKAPVTATQAPVQTPASTAAAE